MFASLHPPTNLKITWKVVIKWVYNICIVCMYTHIRSGQSGGMRDVGNYPKSCNKSSGFGGGRGWGERRVGGRKPYA